MKKLITSLLSVVFIGHLSASACDVCGSGATNYNFGVLPQFHKNFVTVRYRYARFESHPAQKGAFVNTQEQFQTTELWGRFYLNPRLQLMAIVPYLFNQQSNYAETKRLQGLGDASVLLSYNLFDVFKLRDSLTTIKHSLWVGGGVKTATGKYAFNRLDFSQVANANFQLGTGSWDALLNALYTFRFRSMGLNANATYRLTTANANNYQFGNQFNAALSAFYVKQYELWGIMPSIGVLLDQSTKDRSNAETVLETGGHVALASGGVDVFRKKWSVGISAQLPLIQHLGAGKLRALERVTANATWLF